MAKTRAIDTYDSGPSAGVIGASYVAHAVGAENVCTFDVGGTTTDVAFLAGGRVPVSEVTEVGEVVIPHPSVSLSSFGIGGGSIISLEAGGEIRVGPRSAGASPGPACFGLGGEWLTPTDVWLLLGYLEPGDFLGGRRRLSLEPARAVAEGLALERGTSVEDALLDAVTRSVESSPRTCAPGRRVIRSSARATRSAGGCSRMAVAAACCAWRRPTASGSRRVVVFPHSSVFSAFGAGLLPIAHAYQAVVPAGSGEAATRRRRRAAGRQRPPRPARGGRARTRRRPRVARRGSERRDGLTLAGVLSAPEALVAGDGACPGGRPRRAARVGAAGGRGRHDHRRRRGVGARGPPVRC